MIASKHNKLRILFGLLFFSIAQAANSTTLNLVPGIPDLTTNDVNIEYVFTALCYEEGTTSGAVLPCGDRNKGSDYDVLSTADSSGVLSVSFVSGTGSDLDDGSPPLLTVSGTGYTLTGNFLGTGVFDPTGSTVSATGTTTDASFMSGTFLSDGLEATYGWAGTGSSGIFEFTFDDTDGPIGGDFGSQGDAGGIIISMLSQPFGWTGDWDSTNTSTWGEAINFWQHSFGVSLSSLPDVNDIRGDVNTFMVDGAAVIPVPGALWLFFSGLFGLIGFARKSGAKLHK